MDMLRRLINYRIIIIIIIFLCFGRINRHYKSHENTFIVVAANVEISSRKNYTATDRELVQGRRRLLEVLL